MTFPFVGGLVIGMIVRNSVQPDLESNVPPLRRAAEPAAASVPVRLGNATGNTAATRQVSLAAQRAESLLHLTLLTIASAVIVAACLLRVHPGTDTVILPLLEMPLPGTCGFRRFFGWDCPGCGLTRCFVSVAHADWVRAWRFNPVGIALFTVVAWQVPYRLLQLRRLGRGLPPWDQSRLGTWVWICLGAALFVQWVGRAVAGW